LLVIATLVVVALSVVKPYDNFTWFLEAVPVLIALPLLFVTRARFPITRLGYRLLFLHGVVLLVGAHYSYARVPAGFYFQELFELSRNHYDRLGHIMQGFVPAIIAREILLRMNVIAKRSWLFFLVSCVCLAISAFYELIEWWVAVLAQGASVEFLGTQGDVWDTQWDMFLALIGAVVAQVGLAGVHDRQIENMAS